MSFLEALPILGGPARALETVVAAKAISCATARKVGRGRFSAWRPPAGSKGFRVMPVHLSRCILA
ncbi:hypothetical protein FMN63_08475 [Stappia sp. BW2]|uniref:hypothetical protein n=1 Tax=Stappia sp. BW2 TaxID=2592622 RepID=UPI0011DEF94E|nr:hypothetical protein [Stappia sp. BW2]TYC69947.1 hypothetical protein FMN63_08475 [Stappia sp. BW2]